MFELKLENESGNIVNISDGVNYEVLSISGLNPPSASLFMAKSPNRKGAKHNGSTLNERNIIIKIKILGDIEVNRNALYSWVDTEQYIKVYYRNGVKNVYCEGYVQECPIDFFTDNEVVDVAIVCGDPYFKALQEIVTDIASVLKQFTFSFAIDSEGIPFSTIKENNITTIFNAGAETGVRITIKCNAPVKNIRIFDANDTRKVFAINHTFIAGYVIEIDTAASPKTVKAYASNGVVINLMKYVGNNPTWLTLKKGYNRFGYTAEIGETDAEVSFGFTNMYLGV